LAEDLRIDSHKLIFHPERVADWVNGKDIYPLTIEISPSGACNHRCRFCAFDYLGYKPALLERELVINNLTQMAEKGVKAIVVAGEGEPLLNKATPEIIRKIKDLGMDASMASNGVLFTETIAEDCLPYLSWIRFSVNAGSAETHQLIHQGRPEDFRVIVENLKKAVMVKQRHNLGATLGVQMLLLPENASEVVVMAKLLKDIGVDYFTVKPYSQHPKSLNQAGVAMDYQRFLEMEQQLQALVDRNFQVYFRADSMRRLHQQRRYQQCLGLPFWAYLDSQANLWACIAYVGDPDLCYGNLHDASFIEIWEGNGRDKVKQHVQAMGVTRCRELCRLDEINTYLDQLKNPHPHVNFI
jgi:MoaA/NifB/PqqE/SkfB family radical SAM enzyme